MSHGISQRIKERFHTLTLTMQQVAKYIIYNTENLNNISAREIAEQTNVSTATVIRTVKALGYDDYHSFKVDISNLLSDDKRALRNFINTTTLVEDDWLNKHFEQESENILRSSDNISQTEVDLAAELLLNANHIYSAGWRLGTSVSNHLQFTLKYMLGNVTNIPQGLAPDYATYFKKGDVLIVTSFPRYDSILLKLCKAAREKGVYVISITDKENASIRTLSNINFEVSTTSYGFLDSYTAAVSVSNAMIKSLTMLGDARIKENIESIEAHYKLFN